jgi:hypothetical protein
VHVGQYRQLGTLRFLARYVAGYLRGRLRGLGHDGAYRAIDAEVQCVAAAGRFAVRLDAEPSICRALAAGEPPEDACLAGLAGCLVASAAPT